MRTVSPALHCSNPKRIVVLRALALGDLLCAVPAFRALRRHWSTAEISLIGLPASAEFCSRFSAYIDRFIEFPGYPGLPERRPHLAAIPEFFSRLQNDRIDLLLQLHGSGQYVNEIATLCNPGELAGFYEPGSYCPNRRSFLPWPEHGLEIHRLLSLLTFLGIPAADDRLEFPLTAADQAAFDAFLKRAEISSQYVVIHPGASVPERRWPAVRFAAVADALSATGWQVVVTGTENEQRLSRDVLRAMRHPGRNLAGETDLGLLGALVARAALVVCNDTAISHLAAATRTPSVVISTGDNPARWAPINQRLHRVLSCPRGVESEEVWRTARQLLEEAAWAGEPELAAAV